MTYTMGEAAKAAGVTKGAIWQAIASKRLPASKDERNRWQIEPDDLFRRYPPSRQTSPPTSQLALPASERAQGTETGGVLAPDPAEVALLRQWLADVREDRDHWRQLYEAELAYNHRLVGLLSADRVKQLEQWRSGTPPVLEMPEPASRRARWNPFARWLAGRLFG